MQADHRDLLEALQGVGSVLLHSKTSSRGNFLSVEDTNIASDPFCCGREVISGEVTTGIPEPTETLVLALGLAALVGFSTRRGSAQNLKEELYGR